MKDYFSMTNVFALLLFMYTTCRNHPKFSDRQVWANSVDPDDQGLHCLPFGLHRLNALFSCKAALFKF